MASAESTHDIPFEKIKALFQELITECEKLPSNKPETWQECEQEAQTELLKKATAEARKRRAEEKRQAKIAEEEARLKAEEAKKKAAAAAAASGLEATGVTLPRRLQGERDEKG